MTVDSFLVRLGIQPRPYWALVRSLVLMDLRSQQYGRATGTRPGELIPPLYWVVGQYLFVSAVVSVALFARVSAEAFALVHLFVSVLLAASSIIVEFNEVVLDVSDVNVVGHRSVTRRTYAAARLTNLAFYMILIIASLNIIPAIMGTGLRDSGFMFLPAYAFACVVASAGVMFLAIIVFSFSPPGRERRDFRDVLAWVQIVVALIAFYGAQLMFRDPDHSIEMFLAERPFWMAWLPIAWLARFVGEFARGPSMSHAEIASAASLALGLLIVTALVRMTAYYDQGRPPSVARVSASPSKSRPLIGPLLGRFARSRLPVASVAFCLLMLRRDQDLRLRTLPAIATVFAFLGIGLFLHELADPFGGNPDQAGFSIVVVQLVVLAVPTVLHNMSFSRDHAAAWLFHAAPRSSRTGFAQAMRVAGCYGLLLPVLVILWVVFAFVWRAPLHAAIHCGIGWMTVVAASHMTLWAMGYPLPFSQPASRGSVSGPVLPYLAGVGFLSVLVGAGEYYASRSPVLLVSYLIALFALVAGATYFPRLHGTMRRTAHA